MADIEVACQKCGKTFSVPASVMASRVMDTCMACFRTQRVDLRADEVYIYYESILSYFLVIHHTYELLLSFIFIYSYLINQIMSLMDCTLAIFNQQPN